MVGELWEQPTALSVGICKKAAGPQEVVFFSNRWIWGLQTFHFEGTAWTKAWDWEMKGACLKRWSPLSLTLAYLGFQDRNMTENKPRMEHKHSFKITP